MGMAAKREPGPREPGPCHSPTPQDRPPSQWKERELWNPRVLLPQAHLSGDVITCSGVLG